MSAFAFMLLSLFFWTSCHQQYILVVNIVQDGKLGPNASMAGGETEALQRLKKFAAECEAQPNKGFKDGAQDSIYGANFSCKISPWLAMGCLSPRSMYDELKKTASRCTPRRFSV
jgi:deoxyribodipyrimidine photolyase